MPDNKYLEKIALNALKARQMAKSVGVIADHTSQWKWALRNLRDGRGNALAGRALAEGKRKLGALDNNAYQQIAAKRRKVGLDTEVGGINHNGKLTNTVEGPHGEGKLNYNTKITNKSTVHTHPNADRILNIQHYKETGSRLWGKLSTPGQSHRVTTPSGSEYLHYPNVLRDYKNHLNYEDRLSRYINKMVDKHGAGEKIDVDLYHTLKGEHYKLQEKVFGLKNRIHEFSKGDIHSFAKHSPNRTHNIVTPELNAEAVHKTKADFIGTPVGLRTVYFDRTPRKAK